jgi:hypothetical protein
MTISEIAISRSAITMTAVWSGSRPVGIQRLSVHYEVRVTRADD